MSSDGDDTADVLDLDVVTEQDEEERAWNWGSEPPTYAEVKAALLDLPNVYGVTMVSILDYIIAIPGRQEIKDERGRKTGEWKTSHKLYCTVAGRVHLVTLCAIANGWSIQYTPAETGGPIPGIIDAEPKVYRETVTIRTFDTGISSAEDRTILLTATGTSKFKGGDHAWEKAETAARGRALGSLGFGILPGSGIASAEEMDEVSNAPQTRLDSTVEADTPQTDEEWMQRFRERQEQLRAAREMDVSAANIATAAHVQKHFGKVLGRIPDSDPAEFEWSELTPGEVVLLVRNLEKELRRLSEETQV